MSRAACVVVPHDGAVLGVSRKDDPGNYGLPGGKHEVVLGEHLAETAARELYEETGLRTDSSQLVLLLQEEEPTSGIEVSTFLARNYVGILRSSEKGIVSWVGWPALVSGSFGAYNARVREALANTDPQAWAERYGSGSLRRAIEEGMRWREMYLTERTALEFGYGFLPVLASRVMVGAPMAAGDDRGTTETCWWARALRFRAAQSKLPWELRVVYARISDGDGGATEGIGIQIELSAWPAWLPQDRKIIALTVGKDGRTVNPC